MFQKTTHSDWEILVKKQLKTDDIYQNLQSENLEGLEIKPFYSGENIILPNLPRSEENTLLVSKYEESLEEDVFAFLIEDSTLILTEKSIFFKDLKTADALNLLDGNRYFSLIDIFSEKSGKIDIEKGKELLAKKFDRNICVDVSFHQNCGASIIQQLAIALSKAKDLVEFFGEAILTKFIFKFAVSSNYFFEIAKIRAFKLLFNQLSKEYGLNEIPFIFVETSLRNKSVNDPENNLIRSTLELSAAMIAGADAVYSNNYLVEDPTPLSEEISFKQQIVLAYESIVNVFDDAGNGSYYVQEITKQLCEKSWKLFLDFEDKGGYSELLKSGELQKMVYEQAIEEQKWVLEGKIKLIGVNLYPTLTQTKEISDLYNKAVLKPVRWDEAYI